MKASTLFPSAGIAVPPGFDAEVTGIEYDSRKVRKGSAFFTLAGMKADGKTYIADAVSRGASVVVSEKEYGGDFPCIVVRDARNALASVSEAFFGCPSQTLMIAGVTGTNGKTTTTYLVESMLAADGVACGVIGTVEYRFGGKRIEAPHTTPEAPELSGILAEMKSAGTKAVAIEVSSHALDMKRVEGLSFDVAAFSNLTRDHLDYHGTMDKYYAAKSRLFRSFPSCGKKTTAVINIDDRFGRILAGWTQFPVISVSGTPEAKSDIHPITSEVTLDGIRATVAAPGGRVEVRSSLVGRHNLANILLAAGIARALGVSTKGIESGIASMRGVPGRLERVGNSAGVACLVDYAHTDDALVNVLTTLRELATARIITVFGCGGDRDRGKRPLMGNAAASLSDIAIVTSDNPRTEDPAAIIREILPGVKATGKKEIAGGGLAGSGFAVIQDRREAIAVAVSAAGRGDILLIAGKGHEDYQIVGTVKHHFDDREEAARAFESKKR